MGKHMQIASRTRIYDGIFLDPQNSVTLTHHSPRTPPKSARLTAWYFATSRGGRTDKSGIGLPKFGEPRFISYMSTTDSCRIHRICCRIGCEKWEKTYQSLFVMTIILFDEYLYYNFLKI